MPALEAPTSSSNPVSDEELEVVFGRQLLQGPTEEEATPLPRVLVQVRESIMEATSSAEAAFRREWAALESERQRLSDWHTRLEVHTKAEASHAAEVRSKLKANQEAYRVNLRKVFDREFAVSSREKNVAQREETFAQEVVSFAAQRSELETRLAAQQSELEARSQGLEVWRQELNNLSATLQGWREQLQEKASKLAVAEAERRTGSPSIGGSPTPPTRRSNLGASGTPSRSRKSGRRRGRPSSRRGPARWRLPRRLWTPGCRRQSRRRSGSSRRTNTRGPSESLTGRSKRA